MKTDNGNFRNRASQRFYEFFHHLVEKGLVTHTELAEAFGVYQSNPRNFLSNLKNGVTQVSAEMIETANEKFGLNPSTLFEDADHAPPEPTPPNNELNDVGVTYGIQPFVEKVNGESTMQRMGKTLKHIMQKHSIKIEPYCKNNLGISRTFFYNMESGKSHIPLDLAVRICEDLGESLDIFRSKPMPKGHVQTELELLRLRLEECLQKKKKS